MPRDFLFDIGNVILRFDFSIALRELCARSSRPPADPIAALEPIKIELESGRIDDRAFVSQCIDFLGFDGTSGEFARIWCEIFELNTPMAAIVEKLCASGHHLYLLSNTSGLHKDYFFDRFPIFQKFLGGVYSHTARSMKPEEQIYRDAFDSFGLVPEATIYIDDNEANIAAGARLGLRSIPYDPGRHKDVLARLLAVGVNLDQEPVGLR